MQHGVLRFARRADKAGAEKLIKVRVHEKAWKGSG
jgi:hypothetical protein